MPWPGAVQDQTVLDDMERASELLPARTPYQMILTHLRKEGEKGLKGISSGKKFKRKRFEHYNDVIWVFREMECNEAEPLHIPMKGFEAFRLFMLY